jgi:hypothetical protein
MNRPAREFLKGFERAARLARLLLMCPPRGSDAARYLEVVADLHRRSPEPLRQGLAAGCLSALGRS